MKYHAKVEYSTNHYFWNSSKEKITEKLLIPYINGQVILITSGKTKKLLNLRSVSRVSFFRTNGNIEATAEKSLIQRLNEPEFEEFDCTEELIKETKVSLTSPQVSSLLQKAFAVPKNQIFVIMKFGDKSLDSAFEGVINPMFEENGIKVIRVDKIQDSGKISDQILENIAESKFILSDLTGSRPNCYYETGFAHALGKPIILTCHKDEKIHFDLAGYRFITWETENDLRIQLKERIKNMINAT